MGKRLSVLLAALGVAGAVAWILVAGTRTPPAEQIEGALAELEMLVRETTAGTHARAITLSQLPRLSWAVATDEATVRDLTAEELAFRPQPGESIEIAQVERGAGEVHRLIIIPGDGLPALSTSAPGLHLVADEGQVRVTAVTKIEPRERAKIVGGLLGVAQRLDLSRVAQHFEALGVAARLETSRGSVGIGSVVPKGRTGDVVMALRSPAADGATLSLQVPQGIAWPHVAGALFLALASIVWPRRLARRAGRPAAGPLVPSVPSGSSGSSVQAWQPIQLWSDTDDPTKVEQESGAPAPITLRALSSNGSSKSYSNGSGNHSGATLTIPTSLFLAEGGSPGENAPVLPPADHAWMEEYRTLFREFVKLRRTCSESTEDLDRDRFIETLHQKRLDLMEQTGAADVKFRLAFDNGKAAVRFKIQDAGSAPAPVRARNR